VLLSLLRRHVKAEVPIEYVESGWVLQDATAPGAGNSQRQRQ
jgi:hypothetical protein